VRRRMSLSEFALVVCASGLLFPSTAAAAGPKWVCEESTFDFGTVWAGARIEHTFLVRNGGDEDLHILEVKPTCGCTLVPDFQRVIRPGEVGRLPSVLDTEKQQGRITKQLLITTNEGGGTKRAVEMAGVVRTVVTLSPKGGSHFQRIHEQFRRTKEVTLTSNLDQPLKLELLTPSIPPYKAQLTETQPGRAYKLSITSEPPYQPGQNNAVLRLKTNVPEAPEYKLSVTAYLPPMIEIRPHEMRVDGNQRQDQWRPLTIQYNGGGKFDVLGIEGSQPMFEVRLKDKKGVTFRYEVRIPAFYRPPSSGEHLLVRTTSAEQPTVLVPILPYGKPPPKEVVEQARQKSSGQSP
jgi:hypothetical protein